MDSVSHLRGVVMEALQTALMAVMNATAVSAELLAVYPLLYNYTE